MVQFNPEQTGSGGVCIAPMSPYDKLVLRFLHPTVNNSIRVARSFIVPIGCVGLLGIAAMIQAVVMLIRQRSLKGFGKETYLRSIIAIQLSTYQLVQSALLHSAERMLLEQCRSRRARSTG